MLKPSLNGLTVLTVAAHWATETLCTELVCHMCISVDTLLSTDCKISKISDIYVHGLVYIYIHRHCTGRLGVFWLIRQSSEILIHLIFDKDWSPAVCSLTPPTPGSAQGQNPLGNSRSLSIGCSIEACSPVENQVWLLRCAITLQEETGSE